MPWNPRVSVLVEVPPSVLPWTSMLAPLEMPPGTEPPCPQSWLELGRESCSHARWARSPRHQGKSPKQPHM